MSYSHESADYQPRNLPDAIGISEAFLEFQENLSHVAKVDRPVLIIGELLKQAERYLNEGLHPRVLVEGFDAAKVRVAFTESLRLFSHTRLTLSFIYLRARP